MVASPGAASTTTDRPRTLFWASRLIAGRVELAQHCEKDSGVLEVVDLRHGQWGQFKGNPGASLDRIKGILSMEIEPSDVGWSPESARLFAIDTAMLALRHLWSSLAVEERSELSDALQEARRLVVEGHDDELGYLQSALESHLIRSDLREVWITALNALLPSPYRAAEATLEALAPLHAGEVSGPFEELLRQRLRARLGEGMLLLEADLFVAV